jgi:hypothetical protein
MLLAGCSGDADGPDRFGPGRDPTGTSGGGASAALVGTWRTVLVVEVPGDLQTWTTTWRFAADGTCHQTRETESLSEGVPRVTERSCTYSTSVDEITVRFETGGELVLEFGFADFSPDRLVLDGFEYERLS